MSKEFVAATLALGLFGCASTTPQDRTAISGLRIFERNSSNVAGTFAEGDAGIDFQFTVTGKNHTAIIRSADGRPLITSTLAGDVETTTYLGRLTITGSPGKREPIIAGDVSALEDLADLPETHLLNPLRESLAKQGIARDLYAMADDCVAWSWWSSARCPAPRRGRALVSRL